MVWSGDPLTFPHASLLARPGPGKMCWFFSLHSTHHPLRLSLPWCLLKSPLPKWKRAPPMAHLCHPLPPFPAHSLSRHDFMTSPLKLFLTARPGLCPHRTLTAPSLPNTVPLPPASSGLLAASSSLTCHGGWVPPGSCPTSGLLSALSRENLNHTPGLPMTQSHVSNSGLPSGKCMRGLSCQSPRHAALGLSLWTLEPKCLGSNPEWPWVRYSSSLGLSFLIHKMRIIISISQPLCRAKFE